MTWKTLEVAPGITRIESILGPRPFSQYLLHDERSMLVDTGVKETPGRRDPAGARRASRRTSCS